ncbi:MAG: septum formation initiator family protein [Chthoniobacterales bacterium]|nr:septum formation initiator family protein [Chthoniobacterales bacterium]
MNFFDEEDNLPVRRRRHQEPDFWHRLNRVLGVLLVFGILAGVGIVFYPVWDKQQDMRANLASLQREQDEKSALLAKAHREIELLRTDAEYVETIARDRLNLMKPGETIFRVELPRTLGTSVQP